MQSGCYVLRCCYVLRHSCGVYGLQGVVTESFYAGSVEIFLNAGYVRFWEVKVCTIYDGVI